VLSAPAAVSPAIRLRYVLGFGLAAANIVLVIVFNEQSVIPALHPLRRETPTRLRGQMYG
jgi:hypothetical protein